MNALSLVSGPFADDFFPFSLIRSVADIRCGILTIREKWNHFQKNNPSLSGGNFYTCQYSPRSGSGSITFGDRNSDFLWENQSILLNLPDILRV